MRENISKEEADKLKTQIEAVGGTVEIEWEAVWTVPNVVQSELAAILQCICSTLAETTTQHVAVFHQSLFVKIHQI